MTTPAKAFYHPTADVEEGASVGAGSKVWHYVHIRKGATVGEKCIIGRGVFIDAGAVLATV
jgi:UDP-3-O-[3-hydroxymyristoyl] glucosamine N-acyltransferase